MTPTGIMCQCPHEETIIQLRLADAQAVEWRRSVDNKLDAILNQTTATNGRVRALEDWRNRATGAAGACGAAAGVIGAGLVALIEWATRR